MNPDSIGLVTILYYGARGGFTYSGKHRADRVIFVGYIKGVNIICLPSSYNHGTGYRNSRVLF